MTKSHINNEISLLEYTLAGIFRFKVGYIVRLLTFCKYDFSSLYYKEINNSLIVMF